MRTRQISEGAAYDHIREQAMTKRVTTEEIAAAISNANEILSLIFRNLMDRKSILNCSLVSTHWHGPARTELARITQDMPFNGQGLVHAIRYISKKQQNSFET